MEDHRWKWPQIYYIRHTDEKTYGKWYSIACDRDTRYWIFDDSCEPVGLTASPIEEWVEVTKEEYDSRTRSRRL